MPARQEAPKIFSGSEQEGRKWQLPVAPPVEPIGLHFYHGTEPFPVEQPYFLRAGEDIFNLFQGRVLVNPCAPSFILCDDERNQSFAVVREGCAGLEPKTPPEEVASELIDNLFYGGVKIANLAGAMSAGKSWAKALFLLEAARRGNSVGSIRPDQSRRIDRDYQILITLDEEFRGNLYQVEFPINQAFEGLEETIGRLIGGKVEAIAIDEIGLLYTKLHTVMGMSEEEFNERFASLLLKALDQGIKIVNCHVDRYSFGNPWPPINAMINLKRELGDEMLFKRLFPSCVGCGKPAEISAVSHPYHWYAYLGEIPLFDEDREESEVITVHPLYLVPEETTWAIEQPYPVLCPECNDIARPEAPSVGWPVIKWPEE